MKVKKPWGLLFILVASSSSFESYAKEYLVKWRNPEEYFSFLKKNSFHENFLIEKVSDEGLLLKFFVQEGENNFLNKLKKDSQIEYVVSNADLRMTLRTSDLRVQRQWALDKVNAVAAWKLAQSQGSKSVVVAVLDTGVDSQHESLRENMLEGYDFKDNDSDPSDETSVLNPGHGTHCAGIVGGVGLQGDGIWGMSPKVSILPVRILGRDGGGKMDDAVQGIDYAISKGAHVISASWSGEMLPSEAAPLIEAIQRAESAGITFVTSAGNGDENGIGYNIDYLNIYPAGVDLSNVVTVAATDEKDLPTKFSNIGGRKVHLAAPGMKILSTLPHNKYAELSGTSMSTPLVAGLVALLKSLDSSLLPHELKALMQGTASQINMRTACSCRVDAWSAVETIITKRPFVIPNAVTLKVGEEKKFFLKNSVSKSYMSLNPDVASFNALGILSGIASGHLKIKIESQSSEEYLSNRIRVKAQGDPEDDPGDLDGNTNDPYACPYANPDECREACQESSHPWCEISYLNTPYNKKY